MKRVVLFSPMFAFPFLFPVHQTAVSQPSFRGIGNLSGDGSTVVDRTMLPGFYEATLDASALRAGVYYGRLTAGKFTGTI